MVANQRDGRLRNPGSMGRAAEPRWCRPAQAVSNCPWRGTRNSAGTATVLRQQPRPHAHAAAITADIILAPSTPLPTIVSKTLGWHCASRTSRVPCRFVNAARGRFSVRRGDGRSWPQPRQQPGWRAAHSLWFPENRCTTGGTSQPHVTNKLASSISLHTGDFRSVRSHTRHSPTHTA
jgi:hypothetical protein